MESLSRASKFAQEAMREAWSGNSPQFRTLRYSQEGTLASDVISGDKDYSGDRSLPTGGSSYVSSWLDDTTPASQSSSPLYRELLTNQATTVLPARSSDLIDEPLFSDRIMPVLMTADLQTKDLPEPFSVLTTLVYTPHTHLYSQSNPSASHYPFEGHGEVDFSTSEFTPSFVAEDHQLNTQSPLDMLSGIPAENEEPWVMERELIQDASFHSEAYNRAISPTESELVSGGFEFHSQLAEEIKIDRFNHDIFRRTMKHVGPGLPRKLQWYIYTEAGKTLRKRCKDSDQNVRQQIEPRLPLDDVEELSQIADFLPSNHACPWLKKKSNTRLGNVHISSSLSCGNSSESAKQSLPHFDKPTTSSCQPYARVMEKRPDTPRPFDPNIRKSVEGDASPRRLVRGSTPAYEDRSLSPSPASRKSDIDMLDAPSMNPRTGQGSMPPPLTTIRTSSPRRERPNHSQDNLDCSPLDRTASPSQTTSTTSSRFPEAHSASHTSPNTPRERTGAKTIPGFHTPVKPQQAGLSQIPTLEQTKTLIPSLPLVPSKAISPSLRPAKRGQRRNSVARGQSSDKIEKKCSVTSSIGLTPIGKKDNNSDKINTISGKGTTLTIAVEKRRKAKRLQRAVILDLNQKLVL